MDARSLRTPAAGPSGHRDDGTGELPHRAPRTQHAEERRADVQGLRGLAVLLVVAFHAGLGLPGGFVGVDVFFVISGFVISKLLLREMMETGRLRLGDFYLRRARRLLPALAATSTVVALLGIFACPLATQETAAFTSMSASAFMANGYLYRAIGYFRPTAELNPALHTWSLSVEEQFYFIFPALLFLCWWFAGRVARPRARILVTTLGVAAACALSLWLSAAMTAGHAVLPRFKGPTQFAFYSSPTRSWEFGAGVLLALAAPWTARIPRSLPLASGALGLAAVGAAAFLYDGGTQFPGIAALLPVLGATLLVVAGSGGPRGVAALMSTRPLVWIGDRSYSWYLWHWPFIVYARTLFPTIPWAAAVASGLSLVPSWASYRFLENPIRHARNVTPRGTLLLAATCVTVPMLACATLLFGHRWITATSSGRAYVQATLLHVDERVCGDAGRPIEGDGACAWRVPGARGRILVVGDSNAGQFAEPVIRAGNAAGYDVVIAVQSGCPFLDALPLQHGVRRDACRAFTAATLAQIEAHPPSLVVLAMASDGYIEETRTTLESNDGALAATPDAKAEVWAPALRSVTARIARVAPVVLVHPVPRFGAWTLESCSPVTVLRDLGACGTEATRTAADAFRRRAVAAESRALAGLPNATEIDFTERFCGPTRCSTRTSEGWMFRDGTHLSVEGALTLTDAFAGIVASRARPAGP